MITTYRAKRRMKAGNGVYVEPDTLLPELHLARTTHSLINSGYAYETQIEPEKFVEEMRERNLADGMAEQILQQLGLEEVDGGVRKVETDPVKHPETTVVPPAKPAERRVSGPRNEAPPKPVTKRAPRKAAAKRVAGKAPAEKVADRKPQGSPKIPMRTLD